ncbi:MAG: hypothetical protein QOC37_09810 [Nitrososphaeraceae archaeon]|nr:hypothetical protein [Nitrososphaeraceae archaeon]MDW0249339.1 hypothetical protein [Nitrososphaeraceae archaeon]MDW3614354.1 hypothetical protein [Nitrososphaeraceae archaeon]MDW3645308.1 hypothetical protein [Nitrososphaeraceae archaeon]
MNQINLKFKSVVNILLSLSNLSIKIAITVFLQLVVVLSFQNGLNSTYAQKLLQVTTNKASNLTESHSGAANENNSRGVQILKNSSFIDSSGSMHVDGEVRNNLPSAAVFVTIVGTFYDVQNDVVATQFTYTRPIDIESGQNAPFEIIVTSASVPISLIDHYKLQINYE